MYKMRKCLFETNSSSTHSIIVTNEVTSYTDHDTALSELSLDELGVWHLTEDELEFGWDLEYFTSFAEKVRYAIASYSSDPEKIEEIEDFLYSFIPELTKIDYPENPYYDKQDPESSELYYGYVDHQSLGVLEEFLTFNGVSLEEFLLSDKYMVETDNDNH